MATKLDQTFNSLDTNDQKKVLATILTDDWAPVIKATMSTALPAIWNLLKRTSYIQRALATLKDYTGVDLNDDNGNYLGNHFTTNVSNLRSLQWDELSPDYARESRAYDGVSI